MRHQYWKNLLNDCDIKEHHEDWKDALIHYNISEKSLGFCIYFIVTSRLLSVGNMTDKPTVRQLRAKKNYLNTQVLPTAIGLIDFTFNSSEK